MKKKKFNGKLILNKESIAKLNSSAMNNILGGAQSWPNDCPSLPNDCKTDNFGTCLKTKCVVGTVDCQQC